MATYQTVVAGTTITAAWGNNVRDGLITTFATAAARTSAIASPPDGLVTYLQDPPKRFEFWDGSVHRPLGGYVECTSATRPTARNGLRIRETDTGFDLRGNGTKFLREQAEVIMTTAQGWTSTTVYTLITGGNTVPSGGVQFPLEANCRYRFEFDFGVQAASGAGLAVQALFPSGCICQIGYIGNTISGTFQSGWIQGYTSGGLVSTFGGTGASSMSRLHGEINVGGVAGNLQFAFTQGASNATTSFLLLGSVLRHRQYA